MRFGSQTKAKESYDCLMRILLKLYVLCDPMHNDLKFVVEYIERVMHVYVQEMYIVV